MPYPAGLDQSRRIVHPAYEMQVLRKAGESMFFKHLIRTPGQIKGLAEISAQVT